MPHKTTPIFKTLLLLLTLSATATTAVAASPAAGWKGQGEAGLIKASGNTDSENFNIGLDFQNHSGVWHHELGFDLYQASSDGADTADSIAADYTSKRDIWERSFLFANVSYLDDGFDGFTEQASVSAGYGYRLFDSEPITWEVAIGAGYRDTSEAIQLADGTEVEGKDLSGATLVLRSDYRSQITANTQFIDAFRADIGSDNTFVENDAGLLVSMNDIFSLKVGFLVRHNTDPAPGADETDTISSLSLVYNFAR